MLKYRWNAIWFCAGYGVETVLTSFQWLGWVAFALASVGFAWWAPKDGLRKNLLWPGRIGLILLVIGFWSAFLINRGPELLSPCMSVESAREILREADGKRGPLGRPEALKCLIRAGSSLRYEKIRGAELDGYDFRGGNFSHVRFMGGTYNNAVFPERLEGAILSGAELFNADFRGSNLGSAFFGEACIDGVMYKPAKMNRAVFDKSTDLLQAMFTGVTDLECYQLTKAQNWQTTCRDERLACGAPIDCSFLTTAKECKPIVSR